MNDVVTNLQKAQEGVRAQIAAWQERDKRIQRVIDEFKGGKPKATYSISEDRFNAIKKYLEKHPRSRQSDIARNLSVNTGSVSQALKKLEGDGLIVRQPKEGGSWVWEMPANGGEPIKMK